MKFLVYIGDKQITEVNGSEAAYEIFYKAVELADLIGEDSYLIDGETGEVIADTSHDSECGDYEPDFDECGYDPYAGYYTYDC